MTRIRSLLPAKLESNVQPSKVAQKRTTSVHTTSKSYTATEQAYTKDLCRTRQGQAGSAGFPFAEVSRLSKDLHARHTQGAMTVALTLPLTLTYAHRLAQRMSGIDRYGTTIFVFKCRVTLPHTRLHHKGSARGAGGGAL